MAELIRSRLGAEPDPAFTAACLTATGGNPLLLRPAPQLARGRRCEPGAAAAATPSARWGRARSRARCCCRLHRLPDEAAAVAQAVAVLGDGAQLPLVAALAGLDEQRGRRRRPLRWRGPTSCARSRRSASCTRWSATRSTTTWPRPSGSSATPKRRPAAGGQAPRPRRWRHSCSAAPGAARSGSWTSSAKRPRRRGRRGAADSAAAYLERALEEPPPAGAAGAGPARSSGSPRR